MFPLILKKIILMISQAKRAWDFLLDQSIFPSSSLVRAIDSHSVRQTVCDSDRNHPQCAVCLCNIGGGDEIRLLKCGHVFHRVCLDSWVGYGRWTCPLCRNHLRFPGSESELRQETLLFSFANVSSSNKDTWWLR